VGDIEKEVNRFYGKASVQTSAILRDKKENL